MARAACAQGYIELFQGTPLLMQLFLAFFGLGLFGIDVPAWLAAGVALILWTAAFLAEIWRGCVEAIAKGQWEASASLGMGYLQQMRYVILPQALRIAIPPTVGFSVQVVKGTALTSIIGFVELSKAGTVVTNATFQPFTVYGLRGADLLRPVLAAVASRARSSKGGSMSLIAITEVRKSFGVERGAEGHQPRRRAGRGHRHHRQERLGQVDAAALHQRARDASTTGSITVAGAQLLPDELHLQGAAAEGRHDLPELQPVPAPDGRQERHAVADGREEDRRRPKPRRWPARCSTASASAHKFDAYPDELSGGQQQRVAIARALAMQPMALLCDEITSALDPELVDEVLAVVRELAREGMTLLMVTHEMRFARDVCSRVVFMHQGRVHEIGPPEEVFAAPRTARAAAVHRRALSAF